MYVHDATLYKLKMLGKKDVYISLPYVHTVNKSDTVVRNT